MSHVITLTTDFGLRDHYVGAMKGVILSINPHAIITDITHEIRPYDVFEGAFALRNFYRYFPKGTIHVVVVDPGVGSTRKPIAVETEEGLFVGPDNGVFTFIYSESRSPKVLEITNTEFTLSNISSTFHGRDIFAPVAAHLSLDVPVGDLGKSVSEPVMLGIEEPEIRGREIIGKFIHIDGFGNMVTNIPASLIGSPSSINIGNIALTGIGKSYAETPKGEILAIIGSSGFLEISINQGRACDVINKSEELKVKIKA